MHTHTRTHACTQACTHACTHEYSRTHARADNYIAADHSWKSISIKLKVIFDTNVQPKTKNLRREVSIWGAILLKKSGFITFQLIGCNLTFYYIRKILGVKIWLEIDWPIDLLLSGKIIVESFSLWTMFSSITLWLLHASMLTAQWSTCNTDQADTLHTRTRMHAHTHACAHTHTRAHACK